MEYPNKEKLTKELEEFGDEIYKFGIRRFLVDDWIDHQIYITECFQKKNQDWDEHALSMILSHCPPEYWATKILENNVSLVRKEEGTAYLMEHPEHINVYFEWPGDCHMSKAFFEPPTTLFDVQRYFNYGNGKLIDTDTREMIAEPSMILREGATYNFV